jgi:Ras-related protein Rab-4B
VTRSYYRGAAGALLVYDITNRESFNSLTTWLTDARSLASPNIVIILVGNKKDLEEDREVTHLEASKFAQENGTCLAFRFIFLFIKKFFSFKDLIFLETSAITGENIHETFLKCSRLIFNRIENGDIDPDRIGSGIQYGDVSLRNIKKFNNRRNTKNANCSSASCTV